MFVLKSLHHYNKGDYNDLDMLRAARQVKPLPVDPGALVTAW